MNDRPESEDGEIERLRAEAADLRGRIDRLERDRAPAGDRCDCPDCSHRRPVPAVGPWFIHPDTGLVICWLSIAAMILHIVTMRLNTAAAISGQEARRRRPGVRTLPTAPAPPLCT
ncbi:MAG: hypothetical protein OXE57_15320 [Alphaproteobacteria bacterium]|nr:hypothetical protein [Alphaproteobacteria bacterium]